jgi:hydroxymethylpyrimidine/phosphomethylpyrimidine kinase
VRTALTIAGSDSSSGAGIQADLKTMAAFGVFGTCAITALTAQNTTAVVGVAPVSPEMVVAQIDAVLSDIPADAIKTGMLATRAIVDAVADRARTWRFRHLVVDPIVVSSSGRPLLDDDGVDALRRDLLPLAAVVTPNVPEAERLSGRAIATADDRREAARRIHALGTPVVVITGGHAEGTTIVDLVFDGTAFHEFPVTRVESRATHGTGCTFSAAVAAQLALGRDILDAVQGAQTYVATAIRRAPGLGTGHGPLGHL